MQADPHRPQRLYWNQLVELKVASVYIRLHRNRLARYDTLVSTLRAIASSGGIAGWAIWHEFALAWATVIALSQVVDALRDVFPFSKRLKAASDLTVSLERLCIDAQFEWEVIYAGRMNADQIVEACRRLQVAQLDAESKTFPSGFTLTDGCWLSQRKKQKLTFGPAITRRCISNGKSEFSDANQEHIPAIWLANSDAGRCCNAPAFAILSSVSRGLVAERY